VAGVALATCADLPDGDEDAAALCAALARLGIQAEWRVWDDPATEWSELPVVVRSTWDYTFRRAEFLAWVKRVPDLFNPADVIDWNSDKLYLSDLADADVAVVPTTWAQPGAAPRFPDTGEFVVKPSVGAGSRGTGRFRAGAHDAALAHAQALHGAGRTVMVQPYLVDVDDAGETALIYLNGIYSHAIAKAALLPDGAVYGLDLDSRSLYVNEVIAPRAASADELAVGEQVMRLVADRFGGDLLYARVDLLPTPEGPRVIELELTEPSLFLGYAEGAVDRFAEAIATRVGG
jgi:hypothetical protein